MRGYTLARSGEQEVFVVGMGGAVSHACASACSQRGPSGCCGLSPLEGREPSNTGHPKSALQLMPGHGQKGVLWLRMKIVLFSSNDLH